MKVALVHDYLTQRGGAERVVLSMVSAFPEAQLYASLYDEEGTFPEFSRVPVLTTGLDRVSILRRRHRLALPLLAGAVSRLHVRADVVLCSSSGWAHGVATDAPKVVYCHAPARWLYQRERYVRNPLVRQLLRPHFRRLEAWDKRAYRGVDRILVNSTAVRESVRRIYGVDAEVLPPPVVIDPAAPQAPIDGIEPGFVLCVSRLLPYKNVGPILRAFEKMPHERLVVVGAGPQAAELERMAPANVSFVGTVDDAQVRWLYGASSGLVAASHEDFGLTPLEAATFGKPSAVLRGGGFLDTVTEEETGVFFEEPTPSAIRSAIGIMRREAWDLTRIRRHAARFGHAPFAERLQSVVMDAALQSAA